MIGAGAMVLMVILVGAALVRSNTSRPAQVAAAPRSPIVATPGPSIAGLAPSPSLAVPTPLPTPSPTPTVAPTPEPSDESGYLDEPDQDPIDVEDPDLAIPTPGPTPKASPKPTPKPDPSIALEVNGIGDYQGVPVWLGEGGNPDAVVSLIARDLDQSQCTLTHLYEPDDPTIEGSKVRLEPVSEQTVRLEDGTHTFEASCPTSEGPLRTSLSAIARDGRPEACKDFEFTRDPISVSTFDDLASGIIGTWQGCASTPWTPMFAVTFVFRSDGTYSAVSEEVLDGEDMTALYYGTDADSPLKKYAMTDLQASKLGLGEIDIFSALGTSDRDELRNIRLMGDKLEFEMFHSGQYGPLTYQLNRVTG